MPLYIVTHFVLVFYTLVFTHINMENVFVVIKQVDKKDSRTTTFAPDLVVIELLHGCFGLLFCAEGHECVTTVVTIEVHHHPHLIDLTKLKTDRQIQKEKKTDFQF